MATKPKQSQVELRWVEWQCDCGVRVKSEKWPKGVCPRCGRPDCWVRKYEVVTK